MAKAKRKGAAKRKSTRRKVTRRRTVAAAAPAKRKRTTRRRRRSTGGAVTFRRINGRIYKRNPPGGKIVEMVVQGAKDAGAIVAGKAATNVIAQHIPFGAGSPTMDLAKQIVSAAIVGIAARRFVPRDVARLVFAGGLVAPVENAVAKLNIPVLSPALSGGLGSYPMLGAYYQPPALPVSVAVNGVSGIGEHADSAYYGY